MSGLAGLQFAMGPKHARQYCKTSDFSGDTPVRPLAIPGGERVPAENFPGGGGGGGGDHTLNFPNAGQTHLVILCI